MFLAFFIWMLSPMYVNDWTSTCFSSPSGTKKFSENEGAVLTTWEGRHTRVCSALPQITWGYYEICMLVISWFLLSGFLLAMHHPFNMREPMGYWK